MFLEVVQRAGEGLVFSANWRHCVTNREEVLGVALQANKIDEDQHLTSLKDVAPQYALALSTAHHRVGRHRPYVIRQP